VQIGVATSGLPQHVAVDRVDFGIEGDEVRGQLPRVLANHRGRHFVAGLEVVTTRPAPEIGAAPEATVTPCSGSCDQSDTGPKLQGRHVGF
jgi:hypothetical protein